MDANRPLPKLDTRWEWCVRSFKDGRLMLETVHGHETGKNMEVEAIKRTGRTAKVYRRTKTGWELQP